MKLCHSLLQRHIVHSYSPREKQVNVDFVIEAMKCHRDDKHDVRGPETQAEVPPFACSFNKLLLQGHMLAVADEEGGVSLYDIRKQGTSAKLKGWVAHSNAIFDVAWVCDEPKLVTVSGDQTAQLWDVQQGARLAVFKGHSCSVKSVDFQEENLFLFTTGARDGNVMVWDIRCNKRAGHYRPVNTIHNCHSTLTFSTPKRVNRRGRKHSNNVIPDSQQSVTAVKFQEANMLISAGAADGNIKVWDLRKNYSTTWTEPTPYHVFSYPGSGSRKHGYSSLTLDSSKSKLFVNCTDDVIYMYDCVSYQKHPLARFRGHSNSTFYVKSSVSPDDQYLMSGSRDCDGYIWRIDDPNAPPFHLTGHANEVTGVAWCPKDQTKVVTCSDDNSLKIWRMNNTEKANSDFVGWCERKPIPPASTEMKVNEKNIFDPDDMPNKTSNVSPAQSQSCSTANSPVSISSNESRCSSPQESLQNWLLSSPKNSATKTNSDRKNSMSSSSGKRAREIEETLNRNKRVCREEGIKNEKNCEQYGKDLASCSTNEQFESDTPISLEQNKENINNNIKTENSLDTASTALSETQTSKTEFEDSKQTECKKAVTKPEKSNWLRDMGVKKRNHKVPRKVPSQPSSPLLQQHASVNMDHGAKNTKSIRHYFSPVFSDRLAK